MKEYRNITAKERLESLKLTKKAIKEGIIQIPSKCQLCGKTTGRIDYHNETYKSPTENLYQICQGCHTRWHKRNINKDSFKNFILENNRFKKLTKEMQEVLKTEGFLSST
ncbi:MAG: hypothetical protein ACOX0X_00490 [Candidatus Dojkabacteria bacterium]|jgi:hypothetical protein